MILVLAPTYAPDDVIGPRAAWVAGLNVAALRAAGFEVSTEVRPEVWEGLGFFGHGNERFPEAAGGVNALPARTIERVRGGWLHVFACFTGQEFGPEAIRSGVATFAGYREAIEPRWDERTIPPGLRGALEDVLTCVTLCLAHGRAPELRRRLRPATDRVIAWCDENPGSAEARLSVMVRGLERSLVLLSS